MANEEQIKPVDWAKEHGVKVDVVMKLLRDAGVAVRTQVSKLDAKDYEKIEADAEAERQKAEARNKNLKKASSAETSNASSDKKNESASAGDGKLKAKLIRTKKPAAAKPAATVKPAAPKAEAPAAAEAAGRAGDRGSDPAADPVSSLPRERRHGDALHPRRHAPAVNSVCAFRAPWRGSARAPRRGRPPSSARQGSAPPRPAQREGPP